MQEEYYTLKSKYVIDPISNIQKVKSKFKVNVISVDRAKNIIVIKTNPGEAQGVAVTIDGMNFEEILGTVGGDDAIICVASSEDNAEKMVKIFKEF
jgi:transcriptional regulator of arginine metabolism